MFTQLVKGGVGSTLGISSPSPKSLLELIDLLKTGQVALSLTHSLLWCLPFAIPQEILLTSVFCQIPFLGDLLPSFLFPAS